MLWSLANSEAKAQNREICHLGWKKNGEEIISVARQNRRTLGAFRGTTEKMPLQPWEACLAKRVRCLWLEAWG